MLGFAPGQTGSCDSAAQRVDNVTGCAAKVLRGHSGKIQNCCSMSRLLSAEWRPDYLNGIVPLMPPKNLRPDSTEAVAARIKELREAMGYDQAEMCRRTGIGTSAWNNAETGDNRMGFGNATKLRQAFGIGTDYTFFGDQRVLPSEIADLISAYRASQSRSKRA